MKKAFVFLANGFEDIEAIGTIDVLRRGELDVTTVSISNQREVTSAYKNTVLADKLFNDVDLAEGDILILPGGMPGASNLNEHKELKEWLVKYNNEGKYIAAICAAPLVLGGLGILKGKKATCYPSFESTLIGATHVEDGVVVDDNVITGKGPGFAICFGLKIVELLQGKTKADEVASGMLISR
jgi:DJ-1 family protein